MPDIGADERRLDASKWWLVEEWAGPAFCWDLWYSCNYRCSYCWWEMDNAWDKLALQHRILPPEEWIECWDRIYDLHGSARLDILGGEPTSYPRFDELLIGLTRKHRVLLATNLSLSLDRLRTLAEIPPERLRISASYHAEFAARDAFLEKLLLLKERGFEPWVTIVAWPPLLAQLEETRNFFLRQGIGSAVQVFQGTHAGRAYPESYTNEERRLIDGHIPEIEQAQRLRQPSPRGKSCAAGYVYAIVKGNGDVFRCGAASQDPPMGNLFDPGFRLNDAPRVCPYDRCNCRDFVYMWENYGGQHPAGRARML